MRNKTDYGTLLPSNDVIVIVSNSYCGNWHVW